MKCFRRLLKWVGCLLVVVLAVSAAFLFWAIYASRPVCLEDHVTPEQKTVQAAAQTQTSLKILTWNIQMLPAMFGTWVAKLDKMQHLRASWIVDYLKQQDYDVVCLQEAFDPQSVKLLVDGLTPVYPYVVLPRYGGHIWQQSSGVLFLSRVPIKHDAHVVFSAGAGVERFAAKGCTLVEGIKDGLSFQVAGTHFQTGRDSFKLADSRMAAEDILKAHRRDKVPQFFVGDFNIKKDSPQYVQLLKDTGMVEFPIDDPRPYTSDSNNSWKTGKQKLVHIDHILLDPQGTQATITVQHIQRAKHEYNGKPIDLSDHYGIIAEALLRN
jgi:endonuclease/exonuclease/phosphatase family metal-dependent hydrolase